MKSIREIYKIGKGPSSSHTMDLIAFQNNQEAGRLRIESIGGGDIRVPG